MSAADGKMTGLELRELGRKITSEIGQGASHVVLPIMPAYALYRIALEMHDERTMDGRRLYTAAGDEIDLPATDEYLTP